jgi:hypothetical protein
MLSNLSGHCGDIRDIIRRRLGAIAAGRKNFAWCEPDELPIVRWAHPVPMVDIRHGVNCTGNRMHSRYWPDATHWGKASDVLIASKGPAVGRIDDGPRLIRTCVYGQYESRFRPAMLPTPNYDYRMHTDGRNAVCRAPGHYTPVIDTAGEGKSPRHASRRFKFHSDPGYAWSIYHDDNITVTDPDKLIAWCQRLPADFYGFSHARRHCLYEEFEYCRTSRLFKPAEQAAASAQIAGYQDAGYPHYAGLYELGLFVVRNGGRMEAFMQEVRDEYDRHQPCPNDQLTMPYLLWRNRDKIRPGRLPGTVYRNEFSTFHDRPHVEAK